MNDVQTWLTWGIPAVMLIALMVMALRIVPEYQRLVVFRLGRLLGEKGPGLVLLIPFVDRPVRVDYRERFFDVPPQQTITEDNAQLSIDFLVYMKIVDATPSVVNVEDYEGAARGIAITTLRAVVGSMLLDDVLAKRERINEALRGKLDEVTNRWGIKVTAVEIREIMPRAEIEEAMTRQMSAERSRRAMVLEADGRRDAAIRVAEGQKQSAILEAEGARQSAILRADGLAIGLETVSRVARGLDSRTMALQYLDTLRALGSAPSSKFVLPLELVNIVRPFVEHTARTGDEGRNAGDQADGGLPERH